MELLTFKRKAALDVLKSGRTYYSTHKSQQHMEHPLTYGRSCAVLKGKMKCFNVADYHMMVNPIFAWHSIIPGQSLSPTSEQIKAALAMGGCMREDLVVLTLDVPDSAVVVGSFYNFSDALFAEEEDLAAFEFRWTFVFGNYDHDKPQQAILPYIKPEWLVNALAPRDSKLDLF